MIRLWRLYIHSNAIFYLWILAFIQVCIYLITLLSPYYYMGLKSGYVHYQRKLQFMIFLIILKFQSFNSEKLHIHFCTYILGVHKKRSNFAVTSELARYPIQVNILLSALSYWHRLETTSSELLMDAFACSKTLHNEGCNTWFSSISNVCKLLNVSVTTEMLSDMSFKSFKKYLKMLF